MALYNFYIQLYPTNDEYTPVEDIEKKYNCKYKQFKSFFFNGEVKNVYTEDYAEQNGVRIWLPGCEERTYKSYDCTLELLFDKATCQKDVRELYNHINGQPLEYHDTFRNRYVKLLCTKQPSIAQEILYGERPYILVSFVFSNVDGRTYASSHVNKKETVQLSITTDSEDIFITTSRPLSTDEYIMVMTRGVSKSRVGNRKTSFKGRRRNSSLRWHLPLEDSNNYWRFKNTDGEIPNVIKMRLTPQANGDNTRIRLRKSHYSNYYVPYRRGIKGQVTYGLTVAKSTKYGTSRIGNVRYFKRCFTVNNQNRIEAWFEI